MLLAALVAFVGSLVAFAGVTALLRGWFERRESHLLAFTVTLLCLSAGLGAATIMLALEFRPALFRAYEVGIALLAMLWLALGVVELVARSVPAAFAARLFVASFSIVVGVILSLDPLRDVADAGALPSADQLYLQLPLTLLAVAHASVVLIISVSFAAVALRAWRGEQSAGEVFLASLLVLLAALCVFVAIRPELVNLPAVAYMSLLAIAAILVWVAAVRTIRAGGQSDDGEQGSADTDGEGFWERRFASEQTHHVPQQESLSEHPFFAEQGPAADATHADHAAPRLSDRAHSAHSAHSAQFAQALSAPSLADACGYIVIFTLHEGAARPFDRLVELVVEAIHKNEPDTLVYACHTVADAPQQRIFYELYRDREAMQEHERQPHVRRFIAEREEYVLATNVVRLELNEQTGVPEPQFSG